MLFALTLIKPVLHLINTPDEYTAIEAQLAAGTYSYGIFVEGE